MATATLLAEAHMWLLIHPQTMVVLFLSRRPTSRLVAHEDESFLSNLATSEYTDYTGHTLCALYHVLDRQIRC